MWTVSSKRVDCSNGSSADATPRRAAPLGAGVHATGCDNPLRAHKTLDFGLGPVHGILDRLLLLSALGYHLGDDRLRVDLSPDLKRRRITGDVRDHVVTRRIPIVGALGRTFLRPGREVEPTLERRDIEPNAGGNKLFLYLSG